MTNTTKKHICNTLDFVRNKGNCRSTVWRAQEKLKSLKSLLEMGEYNNVSVALSHVLLNEGTAELNDEIAKLQKKYAIAE